MTLAIDIGNSNIKFGIRRDGRWTRRFRISTVRTKTPDEYGLTFRSLLQQEGVSFGEIGTTIVSSVVPPLTGVIAEMLSESTGREPLIVGPGVKTGIRIRTDNPVEVGSDIVVNAVAAHARFGEPCVIVAFGTALTFAAVTATADLLGVAIAPGMQESVDALVRISALLRLVELSPPPTAIGKNTGHSMQAGIVFGYVGLVEELIRRFRSELGGSARVVTTGEQARVLLPLTKELGEFEPWLTLDGLALIAERNAK